MKLSGLVVPFAALLMMGACYWFVSQNPNNAAKLVDNQPNKKEEAESPASQDTKAQPNPIQKIPCPIKLIHSRMAHNLEEDVYTTVQNVSKKDIAAISLGAAHTNRFGDTMGTYRTNLSSEDTIRVGRYMPMHWEILMEEKTGFKAKPGSSALWLERVAFVDGTVFDITQVGGCTFSF